MPNTSVRAAAEGMAAAKEKMTIGDLEPLICDAANMVEVLVNMMEHMGLTSELAAGSNHVLTDGETSQLFFIAEVAARMTGKVKKAFYEAVEGNAS